MAEIAKELRAALSGVTPGPYYPLAPIGSESYGGGCVGTKPNYQDSGFRAICDVRSHSAGVSYEEAAANRRYLAACSPDRITALLDALDAAKKRIAVLEAALIMNPMAERIADLPDFMAALSEWGCEDPNEQADEITKFLNSTAGLRQYLEDQSKAGGRDGN